MVEPIKKVKELLISLTGQPDEAPLPSAIATLEEEVQNTTEFPALNRNWHSPNQAQTHLHQYNLAHWTASTQDIKKIQRVCF